MSEPVEIVAACEALLGPRDLQDLPVLVTAGPTREMLDPVRFLSNPSSGKMGYAVAEAARDRGAKVTLISGPVALPKPPAIATVDVTSAEDLAKAVDENLDGVRVVVMAAAVADQRPKRRAQQKVKKKAGEESLALVRTPDILAGLGARRKHPLLVGFAAETENVEKNAREKLERKRLDLIVANDVADAFGKETNRVLLLSKDGARRQVQGSKLSVAHAIWDMVRELLPS
jgi:phosphopantothenoylcysteine decarboxylase/phosphopantothenate--cysteine ligase